jgi:hypothetical protein
VPCDLCVVSLIVCSMPCVHGGVLQSISVLVVSVAIALRFVCNSVASARILASAGAPRLERASPLAGSLQLCDCVLQPSRVAARNAF